MDLLHERSATIFYDPIATDNYHFQKRRIAQLKEELRREKQQQRAAARTLHRPVLLHRHTARTLDSVTEND